MQEIESTKHIDLQASQKPESNLDSNQISGQINQQSSTATTINSSQTTLNSTKKSNNIFQASLERQRNLLLNMEQPLAIYQTTQMLASLTPNVDTILEDVKIMDIQVDSNNNMPNLFSIGRQSGTLPSINELRNNQRNSQFNTDNLLVDDKKLLRSNLILNQFANQNSSQSNGQFNQFNTTDDSEFNHFEDDFSRLSHTQNSIYDNYELNQTIKMEEDFQDDKFKTSPTLAELNLNDDDMMDNLPTVNPNSILCPSTPLLPNKNGFLMGCNYTNNLTTSSLSNSIATQTDSHTNLVNKDLVLLANNDQFSLTNQFDLNASSFNQLNNHNRNHLNDSTNDSSTNNKNYQSLSTNTNQSKQSASYNTRTRGRQKSSSDKQSKRANQQKQQQQQQQQNLSQTNQVLCKLLNEKNDNLTKFPLITTNELLNPTINPLTTTTIGQSQLPSTSSTGLINSNNAQFQAICLSSAINLDAKAISTQSSLTNLHNDLLLNQFQQTKCGLQAANANNLKINNSATRNRNSSISTEHSFSSHDEGFISQADDDSDDKDDDSQMTIDQKVTNNKQGKMKRKRPRKDANPTNSADQTSINSRVNMKKIKLEKEPDNQFKPSTSNSGGFAFALSTVKEETITTNPITPILSNAIKAAGKSKDEKVSSKGRVNYKITKEKPILADIQQQIKLEQASKLIDEKVGDEESSDDEDDESFYGDFDDTDLIGATTSDDQQNKWSLNMGRSRKNSAQRYFWQYNVQSKGPKGTKLTTSISESALEGELGLNSNLVSDLEPLDPVFSPNCHIEGVKHAGKARRGDGNDLSSNPRKLLMIGLELKKLSKIINDLTPVAEVPQNSKSNSRKEKNKLASRACRLKKKAQHEANKIKLHGLSIEFKKLMSVNAEFKKIQDRVLEGRNTDGRKITDQLNSLIKDKGVIINVAGKTTDFVNSVLDSVSAGNITGGLDKL